MDVTELLWDDDNIEHIARYRVSPNEVEDVAFDDEPWVKKAVAKPDICWDILLRGGTFLSSTS